MKSIRRYLTRTLLGVVVVGATLSALSAWFITDHEMDEIFDAQLAQMARVVAGMLGGDMDTRDYQDLLEHLNQPGHLARLYDRQGRQRPVSPQADQAPPRRFMHEERLLSMGFWRADGSPLLLSAYWNEEGLFPAPREVGYRWVSYDGAQWRVFSFNDRDSDIWISIGLREDFQEELARKIVYGNTLPYLLILPVIGLAIWWIIRRGLKPIDALTRQVARRHHQDLTVIDHATPRELEGLLEAINAFIDRLRLALDRERRFTADAAHELRTPLAGVRIHLDNAHADEEAARTLHPAHTDQKTSAGSPTLQLSSLNKARCGIERLQRVVDQLLTLARLERAPQRPPEIIDLYPIAAQLSSELWPLANERGQQLAIDGLDTLPVRADPTELGVLLRNLIDNALRYTPEGGSVVLRLEHQNRQPVIRVMDDGPGIAPEALEKVTERFHRANDQRTSGSGLGLSIVKELAQRQHARLQLANRKPHGLEVSVIWPVPE
ncbi:ATP-binding protein [Kushneria phosphatilytica]|uniref:histidine kinase n=1 Tax=Kushneria phosphatilytica TaxID=657387 RepID=A0A1S1NYH0_9GAMM|nr:ATP-binding protein [Kushneria phosphatilytica]OHV12915.1 sensor histidine kinase [Kushneria phosphatilytica]QEL10779.1 HAMP domain-containing protein [Kushneria phosphatilytica]